VLTLSAVAEKKRIKLDSLDVEIDHAVIKTNPFASSYQITINVGSELTRREQTILLNSAKFCHVHKIISGESSFNYIINDLEVCEKTVNV
jgi:uncharacterized OsmC-like protein